MAGHIWNTTKLMKETVDRGVEAGMWAHSQGLDFKGVCIFIGYYLERTRQQGDVGGLFRFWDAAVRSNHRYARGTKKGNYGPLYMEGGRRVISAYAKHRDGLIDATPEMVWDEILENEWVPAPVRTDNYMITVKTQGLDVGYVKIPRYAGMSYEVTDDSKFAYRMEVKRARKLAKILLKQCDHQPKCKFTVKKVS